MVHEEQIFVAFLELVVAFFQDAAAEDCGRVPPVDSPTPVDSHGAGVIDAGFEADNEDDNPPFVRRIAGECAVDDLQDDSDGVEEEVEIVELFDLRL